MVIITKNCNYYKTMITNIYQIITMCQALSKALYSDYLLLNFFLLKRKGRPKKKRKSHAHGVMGPAFKFRWICT